MNHRFWGLAAGLLSLCFAIACGGSSSSDNEAASPTAVVSEAPSDDPTAQSTTTGDSQDPVAVVNDEEIPRADYDRQLNQLEASYAQQGVPFPEGAELTQLRQQVMQQLVQQTLVVQETEARNIPATDEEIDAQYQAVLTSFPDEDTFKQTLEEEGLSQDELQDLISDGIKVEKLLDTVVQEAAVAPPTEEELQELYTLVSQQQELPPFEDVRAELEAQLLDQRESEVIQAFVQELESRSTVEILVEL